MKSIRTKYKDIWFRSKLEAQWAKLLDHFGIRWDYEPEGFRFRDGTMYLPDFWLPESETFLEVKGLMDEEDMHKIRMLLHEGRTPVVIGMSCGIFNACDSHPAPEDRDEFSLAGVASSALVKCSRCGRWSFIGTNGSWVCRCCGFYDGNNTYDKWLDSDGLEPFWRFARIDVRQSYEWRST